MDVSSRLGNKFITTNSTDERQCIYIYLVDDMHFHSLTSSTGFFSPFYFCSTCLKHYNTRGEHKCDATCIICKRQNCLKTKRVVKCSDCHMECRSNDRRPQMRRVLVHELPTIHLEGTSVL